VGNKGYLCGSCCDNCGFVGRCTTGLWLTSILLDRRPLQTTKATTKGKLANIQSDLYRTQNPLAIVPKFKTVVIIVWHVTDSHCSY